MGRGQETFSVWGNDAPRSVPLETRPLGKQDDRRQLGTTARPPAGGDRDRGHPGRSADRRPRRWAGRPPPGRWTSSRTWTSLWSAATSTSRLVRAMRPASRPAWARLLAWFTGEHVRRAAAAHRALRTAAGCTSTLKFVSDRDLDQRVEDGLVLWQRDGAVDAALSRTAAVWPRPGSAVDRGPLLGLGPLRCGQARPRRAVRVPATCSPPCGRWSSGRSSRRPRTAPGRRACRRLEQMAPDAGPGAGGHGGRPHPARLRRGAARRGRACTASLRGDAPRAGAARQRGGRQPGLPDADRGAAAQRGSLSRRTGEARVLPAAPTMGHFGVHRGTASTGGTASLTTHAHGLTIHARLRSRAPGALPRHRRHRGIFRGSFRGWASRWQGGSDWLR